MIGQRFRQRCRCRNEESPSVSYESKNPTSSLKHSSIILRNLERCKSVRTNSSKVNRIKGTVVVHFSHQRIFFHMLTNFRKKKYQSQKKTIDFGHSIPFPYQKWHFFFFVWLNITFMAEIRLELKISMMIILFFKFSPFC